MRMFDLTVGLHVAYCTAARTRGETGISCSGVCRRSERIASDRSMVETAEAKRRTVHRILKYYINNFIITNTTI